MPRLCIKCSTLRIAFEPHFGAAATGLARISGTHFDCLQAAQCEMWMCSLRSAVYAVSRHFVLLSLAVDHTVECRPQDYNVLWLKEVEDDVSTKSIFTNFCQAHGLDPATCRLSHNGMPLGDQAISQVCDQQGQIV